MERSKRTIATASSESLNVTHFDGLAEAYDARFGLSVEQSRARARFIRQKCRWPVEGERVLELGCGTGNLAAALVLEGVAAHYVGLDISPRMVSVARRKTDAFPECEFVVGSALRLPFPDGTFSVCVGDAFLHHIVDAEACLREVARVLAPLGVATFNEPNRDGFAFVEFVLKLIRDHVDQPHRDFDAYLSYVEFVRTHEGDLHALEQYPGPDKHVFSHQTIRRLAERTGFVAVDIFPAIDALPNFWAGAIGHLLDQLQPPKKVREQAIKAAAMIDDIIGDAARQHFFMHNQMFLYAP